MRDNLSHSIKAKLLFLEALPTISGSQAALLSMASHLNKKYDLFTLLPGEGPFAEALRAIGVCCIFAPIGRYSLLRKTPIDVLNYAIRLPLLIFITWRLIYRERIDLVYANSARTFIWGTIAATLAGRPIIWHHYSLLVDRKTLALLQFIGQWQSIRRVIAPSEAAAIQFHALKDKVAIIPNGVDTEHFHPDPLARARIRSEYGIFDNEFTVGIVGDLIPLKGQHTLLEAARADSTGACYLIIGSARLDDESSNTYASSLRQMAGNNVIFTGRRVDIPAVLNALDLLVIASTTETGPLVLLEALSCGVPVVSTPVGRATELLPPEALFPIGDAIALCDQLRLWSADSQKRQIAKSAARALAEEQLQLEQFYLRIHDEIERALSHTT
jgi:glycosyltransferase involved in cell wall biosynthesis